MDRVKEFFIDGNLFVGGYFVMFLFLKCMYLIWVVVFENWGNDIFLVLYLIWNVLGRVGNFSGLMINVMKILENFIIFCSG